MKVCLMCQKPHKRMKRSTCSVGCDRVRIFRSKKRAEGINRGEKGVTFKYVII